MDVPQLLRRRLHKMLHIRLLQLCHQLQQLLPAPPRPLHLMQLEAVLIVGLMALQLLALYQVF